MNTNCGVNVIISLGQCYGPAAGFQVGTRINHARHTRIDRPSQYVVSILIEVREIQVTV
jgi:hypothetical protein